LNNVDFVIKLGGSAITDKKSPLTANKKVIENIASELSNIKKLPSIIIVYGGGSFGHFIANKYIHNGKIISNMGISEIHSAMLTLTEIITSYFIKYKIPIFPINSSSCFVLSDNELQSFIKPIEYSLNNNLIPIIGGDIILSKEEAKILSGDKIASFLAKKFNAKTLAFGTDVDGIILDGKILPRIKLSDIENIIPKIRVNHGDVTGGMTNKLLEIKNYISAGGRKAIIFNITRFGMLTRLLSGEENIGTEVDKD
jgi:isopentenyl phosphate kinase